MKRQHRPTSKEGEEHIDGRSLNIAKSLIGETFGRLSVISRLKTINKRSWWLCRCECGKLKSAQGKLLKNGKVRSCGCLKPDQMEKTFVKHGNARSDNHTTEFNTWQNIKNRCYNKTNSHYHLYGGRGIVVCDRWLGENGFENFYSDMGRRPSIEHSIDRYPNNDGIYEPSNCRWATEKQQQSNKRNNVWYEYKGIKMISSDWARLLKVKPSKISSLRSRNKERAFSFIKDNFPTKNKYYDRQSSIS